MGDHFRILIVIFVALALLLSQAGAGITLPAHPRAATAWAADALRITLEASDLGDFEIFVDGKHDPALPPESFSIHREDRRLVIRSSDANGEMYGLFELTEEIANRQNPEARRTFLAEYAPIRIVPAVSVRADNPFLHIKSRGWQAFAQKLHLRAPPPLIPDMAMWKQYIDMLAECRFNVLDLHGIYNVPETTFHNILPYLVSVPSHPRVGDSSVQRRNLNSLRHLISYANKRGVKVTLMNYSAKVDGLRESSLADYTQKAVCILLQELPKLKEIGFRVGESGQAARFYANAYVKGIHDSGRKNVRLYTRSWKTTPEELEALAKTVGGKLDVEIKFNGEHLGLPYQAIQGPGKRNYSYGDFLGSDFHYDRLWQIRANGTHRFWTWADTDFIRRTVQMLSMGNAKGFSLEPQIAYFETSASSYYRSSADQKVYRYIWEKYWPWYLAWGRLSYDPRLPEETLISAYRRRFGEQGAALYAALQASGKIVPMALAYRFTGPDQRNMSPETQSGAFDTVRDADVTPLSFARNTPMDERSFVGIDDFITEKLAGNADGRIGPARVARFFREAAEATQKLLPALDGSNSADGRMRLYNTDLAGASWLGKYYAERIMGTMHLDYALTAGSRPDYERALGYLEQSRNAWAQLAAIADPVFAPIMNPLIGQENFEWESETSLLNDLDGTIPAIWSRTQQNYSVKPLVLTRSEQGEPAGVEILEMTAKPKNGAVEISCRLVSTTAVDQVTLWSKDFPSESLWKSTVMTGKDGSFATTLPLPPAGLLYLIEVVTSGGEAVQFPCAFSATPYLVIPPQ